MPAVRAIRSILRHWLLLAAAVAACATLPSAAAAGVAVPRLVLVEPSVEIFPDSTGSRPPLPSVRDAEAVRRHWPAAVAAALAMARPPAVWTPPADLPGASRLGQVLRLQDAIADAALPVRGAPRPGAPRLSLGAGVASLQAAVQADVALFTRIRAGAGAASAVATLVDLHDGTILRRRALTGVDDDPTTAAGASVLARKLLAGWAKTGFAVAPVPAAGDAWAAGGRSPPEDDLAHAVARLERELGEDPRRVDAPALDRHLHAILCRLDRGGCAGVRVRVLREPGFNAAITPGGLLVLRTGALLRCRDDAEVALMLAHELAHHRRGDARARWQVGVVGDDDRGTAHSRDAERAADAAAIAMVAAAGYDVGAGERLWTRLLAEEVVASRPRRSASSHPVTAERLAAFRAAARTARATASDPAGDAAGVDRWQALLAPHRPEWLDDEVARGWPGATIAMLDAARTAGAGPSAVDTFALAQALRRRDEPGDRQRAAALLAEVVARPDPPPAAWREFGLARLADGDEGSGRPALARFLALSPAAADAPFVAAMLAGEPATASVTAKARGRERRAFDLRLRSDLPWTRQRGIGVEQWTLDGPRLNRLLLVAELRAGEPLLRGAGPEEPRHRPGLRPDEHRERIVAALQGAGWRDVGAEGPRRHDFAGVPGWRSDLTLADAAGLRYRGVAVFAERDGRLTLMLWLAPAEHYFPRDASAIDAMFSSVRFAD